MEDREKRLEQAAIELMDAMADWTEEDDVTMPNRVREARDRLSEAVYEPHTKVPSPEGRQSSSEGYPEDAVDFGPDNTTEPNNTKEGDD